jgi:hypothetical protein
MEDVVATSMDDERPSNVVEYGYGTSVVIAKVEFYDG